MRVGSTFAGGGGLDLGDNFEWLMNELGRVRELETMLLEVVDRYERLEVYYFDVTGITPDCENGTIKRARRLLMKKED